MACRCSYCVKSRNGHKSSMDYSRKDKFSLTWNQDRDSIKKKK